MSLRTRLDAFSDDVRLREPRRTRRMVRGICLILAVLALWPVLPGSFIPALVPALSPFVAVAATLATRTFHAMAWLGLIVGVTVLLRHRLFCRWACPAGLCLEGASRLGRRFGRRTARSPLLGRWIVGLTLGGTCLGYPFLLWLDPLARFTGLFAFGGRGSGLGLGLSVAGFLVLLMLDLLCPNIWCACLCPLGAFQDLLSSLSGAFRSVLRREHDDLKGTGGIVKPRRAAALVCTGPARASKETPHGVTTNRRHMLLAVAAGAAWGGMVRRHRPKTSRPLRPPGALNEPAFQGVCTRCGNCVRACPSGIIERELGQHGLASLLTPVLCFQEDYCREDCVRCTEACPSGALTRLSLKQKTSMRLGLPRVDMDVCLLAEDRECSVCRSRCPYSAIRYVFSETDYTLTPQIDREKCTGCGACEATCPTAPHKAIVVLPT